MDSKSELKRLCTLRPLEMAARIYKLENKLFIMSGLLEDAIEIKKQQD